MTSPAALVNKVWNYAHVLRDDGVSYGDYVEQITCLLFLKMDQERHDHLGEVSRIPAEWRWAALKDKEGDGLDLQGQTFTQGTSADGDVVLTLSGGGTIELNGVAPASFSPTFVA